MISIERTINDFIYLIKRFLNTLYYILFKPLRFIDNLERNANLSVFISPSVFFIISLFIYYCFSDELKPTDVIFRLEPTFIRNSIERVFTFPDLKSIFNFLSSAILTYIALKLISEFLPLLKRSKKFFISIALYWISVQILLHIIALLVSFYLVGLQPQISIRLIDISTSILSFVFAYTLPLLFIFTIYKKYFRYRRKLFVVLSIIPVIIIYSVTTSYIIYQFLYPYLGKKISDEYVVVGDISLASDSIYIKLQKIDTLFSLTSTIVIFNKTKSEIVFYPSKCLIMDSSKYFPNYECLKYCNCRDKINFVIAPEHFNSNLLQFLKPNEAKAFKVTAITDSLTLSKYISSSDSTYRGSLHFELDNPFIDDDERTARNVPTFVQMKIKFSSIENPYQK